MRSYSYWDRNWAVLRSNQAVFVLTTSVWFSISFVNIIMNFAFVSDIHKANPIERTV